jgi:hypothetical protein
MASASVKTAMVMPSLDRGIIDSPNNEWNHCFPSTIRQPGSQEKGMAERGIATGWAQLKRWGKLGFS